MPTITALETSSQNVVHCKIKMLSMQIANDYYHSVFAYKYWQRTNSYQHLTLSQNSCVSSLVCLVIATFFYAFNITTEIPKPRVHMQ
jgi:hypothetical protein